MCLLIRIFDNNFSTMQKKQQKAVKIIEQSEDDSEESSLPMVAPTKTAKKGNKKQELQVKKAIKKPQVDSDEEEDTPVPVKKQEKPQKKVKTEVPQPTKAGQNKKKLVVEESSEEESSEVEVPKGKAKIQAKNGKKSPLVAAKSPQMKTKVVQKKPVVEESSEESSEEEVPVKAKGKVQVVKKSPLVVAKSPQMKTKVVQKKPVVQSSEQSSQQEVVEPVKTKKKQISKPVVKKIVVQEESSEEESEEVPKGKKAKQVLKKKQPKKVESEEEDEEEEEVPVAKQTRKGSKDSLKLKGKAVQQDQEGQFEVCVSGLSFNAYDSDVRELFAECEPILNVKLLTRPDGKSKGLGFVKVGKKSSFERALQLNGTEHLGRTIKVEQSKGKQERNGNDRGANGNQRDFGNKKDFRNTQNIVIDNPTLFVGGLSYDSTVDTLKEHFSQYGDVQARVITDKQTQRPRGFAYLEFGSVDAAKDAFKELNGSFLDGRKIRLDKAEQRDRSNTNGGGNQRFNSNGGGRGNFGGNSFGGNKNTVVELGEDDRNAKKGSIGSFQGKMKTFN